MIKNMTIAAAMLLAACSSSGGNGQDGADADFDMSGAPGEDSVEDNALQPVDEGEAASPGEGPDSVIAESMEWQFEDGPAGPRLSYGEPESDYVRLAVSCEGDMARLHFMRPARVVRDRPDALIVESGGMQWKAAISARASELAGMDIEASIPLSAEAMTAFGAGNPIELRWSGEIIRVPPTDQAGRFLDSCG